MFPIRRGIVIVFGVLWSTLPRTASADVCEVDLTVETSDLGQTYRLVVGESGFGLALCLAPDPSEEDALALAEEPRVVAHVVATGACVTTTDSRAAGRRDPFTLVEVVVAGHNVVLDYQPDGLDCGDPDAIAPPTAVYGRVARLSPVGLGDVDVEVLNLEDDSSMGLYTGPDPDALSADGLAAPLAGGPSPTCSMGGAIQAWYGSFNGSSAQIGVCSEWGLICTFATPTSNYFYIYGNSSPNLMDYAFHWCGTPGYPPYVGGFDPSWTAYPRLYGYGGADTLLSGSPVHSVLYGGDQDDTLVGADGQDYLYGEAGDNDLFGNGDTDRIHGGNGASGDYVEAGSGNDYVYTYGGPDEIHGGSGADYLYGGEGCDTVFGGQGDDVLFGGPDNDHLDGETGLDPGLRYDEIYGGDGRDFMHYAFLCDGEGPEDDRYGDWTWSCGDDEGDWCCMSCQTDCRNALPTNF